MNEKLIREALNELENAVPKVFDPQEPFDVQDLLDIILTRVASAKTKLSEALASLDDEKPLSCSRCGDPIKVGVCENCLPVIKQSLISEYGEAKNVK